MRFLVYLSFVCGIQLCGLEFRDAKGQMDLIPSHLIDVFYESAQGQALHEDVKEGLLIDFSGRGLPCLEGRYIKQVLQYAHDVKHLTKKDVSCDETYLLDAANYLNVKQKELLYHLANRVWGYLRTGKQAQELKLSESDEIYIRNIAKPYLNSPERFVRLNEKLFFGERKNGFTCIDLSFKKLQQTYYDQEYPFALSNGLADFIHNLCISSYSTSNLEYKIDIDLSGHAIKEFIIDDWIQKKSDEKGKQQPKITVHLNVADNNVERVVWSKMSSNLVYEKLNFSGNPVTYIDESVYMLAHSYRSQGVPLKLIIPHHKLSMHEIALAKQQWYLAVNALIDRYSKGHNPAGIGVIVGLLVTLGAGFAESALKAHGILLVGGLVGGMASWFTLQLCCLPRLAHMMAIKTHPDIEKPEVGFDDFHRPFGNTWLEDWQKPQLIFKEENDVS